MQPYCSVRTLLLNFVLLSKAAPSDFLILATLMYFLSKCLSVVSTLMFCYTFGPEDIEVILKYATIRM